MLPPCLKWLRGRGERSRIDRVPEQDLTTDNLYSIPSPAFGSDLHFNLIHERAFSHLMVRKGQAGKAMTSQFAFSLVKTGTCRNIQAQPHESHRSCFEMPRSSESGDTPLNS
eukprot:scaffold6942_cov103-Skeletonema_dohrnii-CCMP3373.AAC.2